jgi:hypothetical protein
MKLLGLTIRWNMGNGHIGFHVLHLRNVKDPDRPRTILNQLEFFMGDLDCLVFLFSLASSSKGKRRWRWNRVLQ